MVRGDLGFIVYILGFYDNIVTVIWVYLDFIVVYRFVLYVYKY